jgi:hypothetical protein
MFSANQINTL